MFFQLLSNPIFFLIWAVVLVAAITIHEYAHALIADKLGDPTPRIKGRLTLDPRAHLDPLGTITLLLFGFGWGKPVQFDIFNLKDPKKDSALIALAGPVSNLILAGIISILAKTLLPSFFSPLVRLTLFLNVMLAIFNLVPVYPLDGEKIMVGLLPRNLAREYRQIMQRYGTLILILLIFPFGGSSPISALISPIINTIVSFLLSPLSCILFSCPNPT